MNFSRIITTLLIGLLVLFTPSLSLGAGVVGPTGPQTETGVVEPTGPQTETGTTEELVGPQGETGTVSPTGPQTETGVVVEESQNTTSSSDDGQATNSDNATSSSSATNEQTGTNSTNENDIGQGSDADIKVENNSEVNNDVQVDLNSGRNSIGGNTSAGNVKTGDIDANVNIINFQNSVLGDDSSYGYQDLSSEELRSISLNPALNRVNFRNSKTGESSENSNNLDYQNTISIFELNNAIANNDLEIVANTGENDVFENTKIGDLLTGDIKIAANLINLMNLYMPNVDLYLDIWSLQGDYFGEFLLANDTTGANSQNENHLDVDNDLDVEIINNAIANNNVDIETNTGENDISSNTAMGGVETGDQNIQSNIVNLANIQEYPMFYLFNVFGEWDGSGLNLDPAYYYVNQINEHTGANSENTNNASIENDVEATQVNFAQANNNLRINANTGKNNLFGNTVAGNLKTGSIDIASNIINVMNSAGEGIKKFALGIVNIFGNWGCPDDDADDGVGGGDFPPVNGGEDDDGDDTPPIDINPNPQPEPNPNPTPEQPTDGRGGDDMPDAVYPTQPVKTTLASDGVGGADQEIRTLQSMPETGRSEPINPLYYWLASALVALLAWGGLELATAKAKRKSS